MTCPICGIPMEEYAIEPTKIVYKDNGEDAKLRIEKNIFVCPECRQLIGRVEE